MTEEEPNALDKWALQQTVRIEDFVVQQSLHGAD